MKKYLKTVLTTIVATMVLMHIFIGVFLCISWDFVRIYDLFESSGYWSILRTLVIFSILFPILFKFKITIR
jgi:hypothetical protein